MDPVPAVRLAVQLTDLRRYLDWHIHLVLYALLAVFDLSGGLGGGLTPPLDKDNLPTGGSLGGVGFAPPPLDFPMQT